MSFFSTRGGSCVTASQAILRGLAGDGGLYVPSMFPVVPLEKTSSLSQMSYPRRAAEILKLYLEDFSPSEIQPVVAFKLTPTGSPPLFLETYAISSA